ncbi:MAG: GH36-type glycosyl hydrolase domain-containing protein [Promethearchaeota archaeon]
MKGDGSFGKWITDEFGLPAYEYTCDQYKDPNALTPTTYGFSLDHFHQIGNTRIAATAHNGGYVQVIESSRGFQWLTYYDPKKHKMGGGITLIEFDNSDIFYSDLYTSKVMNIGFTYRRIFGMGYFQKEMLGKGIKLKNTICTPFSDDPVFISEVELKNNTKDDRIVRIINFWDIYLRHLTKSLIVTANNRRIFGKTKLLNTLGRAIKYLQKITKLDTDGSRDKFDKKFKFKASSISQIPIAVITPFFKKKPPHEKAQPAKHNYYPKPLFLSLLNEEALRIFIKQDSIYCNKNFKVDWDSGIPNTENKEKILIDNPCLGIGKEFKLKPKTSIKLIFIFGYASQEEMPLLIEKYKKITLSESILEYNAKKWKRSFIELHIRDEPWLLRESKWHSYYTLSSAFYDEYYQRHRFPQGSIYEFGHGFDGAIRDYALFLPSIIFLNPKFAKEYLILIIELMDPDGKLPYGLHGFGKILSAGVHAKPSDLYLFFLWAITEYIYCTRDFDFLNEIIQFYPKSLRKFSTVNERIAIALQYFFSDKVGFGEHGLIKSNDGDWSDGISLMVKRRKRFITNGESNFNSTFALYLIPRIIPLLKKSNPSLAMICTKHLKNLKNSVLKSFNGKWFYRGWDGQGTPIGDKNIYLEHHTWLLISNVLGKEESKKLIQEIYEVLDKPSPIGQYISYPPQKTPLNILPKGWDVNGGIWHAMNALMTWGYSIYDPEKSFNSLKKNSLTQRADIYSHLWYGIWSGPDAYIADYAENAGEAFYHLPTPMCDFPLMNLNAHACYLLSIIKIMGIEFTFDGIVVDLKLKKEKYEFISPLFSIKKDLNNLSIRYIPQSSSNLIIKIKKPDWWQSHFKIILNNSQIEYQMINDFINIVIAKDYNKIDITLTPA